MVGGVRSGWAGATDPDRQRVHARGATRRHAGPSRRRRGVGSDPTFTMTASRRSRDGRTLVVRRSRRRRRTSPSPMSAIGVTNTVNGRPSGRSRSPSRAIRRSGAIVQPGSVITYSLPCTSTGRGPGARRRRRRRPGRCAGVGELRQRVDHCPARDVGRGRCDGPTSGVDGGHRGRRHHPDADVPGARRSRVPAGRRSATRSPPWATCRRRAASRQSRCGALRGQQRDVTDGLRHQAAHRRPHPQRHDGGVDGRLPGRRHEPGLGRRGAVHGVGRPRVRAGLRGPLRRRDLRARRRHPGQPGVGRRAPTPSSQRTHHFPPAPRTPTT